MMQGDSYPIGISILNNAGNPVTPDDVRDIEITIGPITKKYSVGQLMYTDGQWLFPITQKDTLNIMPGVVAAQVRVAWANGIVEGKPLYGIRNEESISREVI